MNARKISRMVTAEQETISDWIFQKALFHRAIAILIDPTFIRKLFLFLFFLSLAWKQCNVLFWWSKSPMIDVESNTCFEWDCGGNAIVSLAAYMRTISIMKLRFVFFFFSLSIKKISRKSTRMEKYKKRISKRNLKSNVYLIYPKPKKLAPK